jgi:general transcription factor 3C polypeptide 3 (transcription factor C subunit 4)
MARYLLKRLPFATDSFRFYSIINRLYRGHRTWYNSGPLQKFMLRHIKSIDYLMLPSDRRSEYRLSHTERFAFTEVEAQSQQHQMLIHDPAALAMYGHIMCAGGKYVPALAYYFRAYAMLPNDPILNFSIGMCYLQHALKHKRENRQYNIVQALSFVTRYYDLRTAPLKGKQAPAIYKQEAEFNFGRVWHMLGLTHLAFPRYRRVLELSSQVDNERMTSGDEVNMAANFAAEAAFALQTMFALNEDAYAARRVTQQWLVIS